MSKIRVLTVGDVVSEGGCEFLRAHLWNIRKQYNIDFTVVNGENSAKNNGIDKDSSDMIFASGADVITTGNHVWKKKEIGSILDERNDILRPANYPSACPGNGYGIYDVNGYRILVINMLGVVFLDSLESPFECAEKILKREEGNFDISIMDFHAEATSEKTALAYFLDGRISALYGTHTHVQTNDARILSGGTGFVCDIGMTGVVNSVIGLDKDVIVKKFLYKMPVFHNVAEGDVTMSGAVFELDTDTNKCFDVELLNIQ